MLLIAEEKKDRPSEHDVTAKHARKESRDYPLPSHAEARCIRAGHDDRKERIEHPSPAFEAGGDGTGRRLRDFFHGQLD